MDTDPKPRVSVVMPFYNAAAFIEESVESILNQSLRDLEIILINDASTDESDTLIQRFLTDSRITYIQNTDRKGIVHNLNAGIDLASSDLVARMDGDDVAHPLRLEKQLQFMNAHPEIDILGTCVEMVDEKGNLLEVIKKPLSDGEIRKVCFYYGPFVHPSVMYRKEAVIKAGKYRPQYELTEDIDLYFRLLYEGHRAANLPDYLLKYRQHGNSTAQHAKEIGQKSFRLKRETIKRFKLKLTPKELLSMYLHYGLDLMLTGDQKRRLQLQVKKLIRT